MKILIIDDNEVRYKKLSHEFSLTNEFKYMEISFCDTSDKGRLLCKNNKFDLLILDVCLPKKIGYKANQEEGLKFLEDLHNNKKYFLPTEIIGITANIDNIDDYRVKFFEFTYVVFPAEINSKIWINNIINHTSKRINSDIKNESIIKDKIVISIHGIRTFGEWQYKLDELLKENSATINHHIFQYNFFDILSFIFPISRYLKAKKLIDKIKYIIDTNNNKKIYIISHSFGTYIIMKLIEKNIFLNKIELLILSGSVLSPNYKIIEKISSKVNKIINDCGINDKVLIINRIFVLGLNDAGRRGFYGQNNDKFINRYFKGGHSLYFKNKNSNKSFMEENWLPYILKDKDLKVIDERNSNNIFLDFINPFIYILSITFKLSIIFLLYYFGCNIFKL